MGQAKPIALATLCGGAIEERFRLEFERALANIHDPNTSATKKREINLKITLEPDAKREHIDLTVESSSKLSAVVGVSTLLYTAMVNGKPAAQEHNPQQLTLDTMQPAATPAPTAPVTGLGSVVRRFGGATGEPPAGE